MSYLSLQNRLSALQDSIRQTSSLIQNLAKLQRSSPNSSGTDTPQVKPFDGVDDNLDEVRADLAAEIHGNLKELEETHELLKLDVEDFAAANDTTKESRRRSSGRPSERGEEARQLQAGWVRAREDLKMARTRFRHAQLRAKRTAELATQREQEAYITSLHAAASPDPSTQPPNASDTGTDLRAALLGTRSRNPRYNTTAHKDDALLSTSSDLTASLRRTHDLLSSELSRSRFAHDTLASSNAALAELNTRYGALDDLLARSRGLLGTLLRSQKSDTWYLETAVWLLLGTIAWLLFRRLLYGPLWWLVWIPLRWTGRGVVWVLGALGVFAGGRNQMDTAVLHSKGWTGPTGSAAVSVEGVRAKATYMREDASAPKVIVSVNRDVEADYGMPEKLVKAAEAMGTPVAVTVDEEIWAEATPEAEAESEQGEQAQEGEAQQQEEPRRRGDGQPLPKRDEQKDPPNPKKRMMEEPPPKKKEDGGQQTRAEL